jgi:hypothetical protein
MPMRTRTAALLALVFVLGALPGASAFASPMCPPCCPEHEAPQGPECAPLAFECCDLVPAAPAAAITIEHVKAQPVAPALWSPVRPSAPAAWFAAIPGKSALAPASPHRLSVVRQL